MLEFSTARTGYENHHRKGMMSHWDKLVLLLIVIGIIAITSWGISWTIEQSAVHFDQHQKMKEHLSTMTDVKVYMIPESLRIDMKIPKHVLVAHGFKENVLRNVWELHSLKWCGFDIKEKQHLSE